MILITEELTVELLLLAFTNKDMFLQRMSDIFDQYPYIKKNTRNLLNRSCCMEVSKMSDTIRMRRLKQQIAEKVIADKKIIDELWEKGIRQDNKELKKANKEAIRLWREDTEKRRVEQWTYDHGKPPEEERMRSE